MTATNPATFADAAYILAVLLGIAAIILAMGKLIK